MIVNTGIIVLLLGLPLVAGLLYQANNSNVESYNREPCGVIGVILCIMCVIAAILCLVNNETIDCSKLIQFKQHPTTSQQYDKLTER